MSETHSLQNAASVSDAFSCAIGTRFKWDAPKMLYLQPSAMVKVSWAGRGEMKSGKL
jgi:hypothetical protein